MASKSSTKQDGEATTEVPGLIVTYTEEINTFKDDMSSENTKKSTVPPYAACNRGT